MARSEPAPNSVQLPTDEECYIFGELCRQTVTPVGVQWQKRVVKVSKWHVCFGKSSSSHLIDFVPLLSISRLIEAMKPSDVLHRQGQVKETSGKEQTKQVGKFKTTGKIGLNKNMNHDFQELEWEDDDESQFIFIIFPDVAHSGTLACRTCITHVAIVFAGTQNTHWQTLDSLIVATGKPITLAVDSAEERQRWLDAIERARKDAEENLRSMNEESKFAVSKTHNADIVCMCMCACIHTCARASTHAHTVTIRRH